MFCFLLVCLDIFRMTHTSLFQTEWESHTHGFSSIRTLNSFALIFCFHNWFHKHTTLYYWCHLSKEQDQCYRVKYSFHTVLSGYPKYQSRNTVDGRNPKQPVDMVNIHCFFKGFSTIQTVAVWDADSPRRLFFDGSSSWRFSIARSSWRSFG